MGGLWGYVARLVSLSLSLGGCSRERGREKERESMVSILVTRNVLLPPGHEGGLLFEEPDGSRPRTMRQEENKKL